MLSDLLVLSFGEDAYLQLRTFRRFTTAVRSREIRPHRRTWCSRLMHSSWLLGNGCWGLRGWMANDLADWWFQDGAGLEAFFRAQVVTFFWTSFEWLEFISPTWHDTDYTNHFGSRNHWKSTLAGPDWRIDFQWHLGSGTCRQTSSLRESQTTSLCVIFFLLTWSMIIDQLALLVLCSLNGSTKIFLHAHLSCIFRFFLLLPSHCLQVSNSTDMSIIVWRTGTGERLSTISAVRDMPRLGPWRNVLGWPVAGVPWHQVRRDGWGLPWGFSGKTICTV